MDTTGVASARPGWHSSSTTRAPLRSLPATDFSSDVLASLLEEACTTAVVAVAVQSQPQVGAVPTTHLPPLCQHLARQTFSSMMNSAACDWASTHTAAAEQGSCRTAGPGPGPCLAITDTPHAGVPQLTTHHSPAPSGKQAGARVVLAWTQQGAGRNNRIVTNTLSLAQ